jgi:ribonuclease T1
MPKLHVAGRTRHWVRLIAGLVLLAVAAYAVWQEPQRAPVDAPSNAPSVAQPRSGPADHAQSDHPESSPELDATIVAGQTIYDREGKVAYEGDVDLTATLVRIKEGQQLRFPNDGVTFQNRERRLPRKPVGYYKEYVHPTPGLAGPGPQRIVIGEQGETYYTPDHYESFRKLERPEARGQKTEGRSPADN